MANDNNIKTFTAADIEKYHKGLLSSRERHALEKAALDDPFLADALEGYATAGVNISADIAELKKRLAAKTEEAKVIPITGGNSSYRWLRAAVVILFIAGAGLLSYQFLFNKKTTDIARLNKKENEIIKANEPADAQPQVNTADTSSAAGSTAILSNPGYWKEPENPTTKQTLEIKTATGSAVAESTSNAAAKGDVAVADLTKDVPATTAPARADEKITGEEKNLKTDNTADRSGIALNNDDKSKDLYSKKKTEAGKEAEANARLNEVAVASKGVTNTNNRDQQNLSFKNNFNYFRGRITDANNNPLPFTNVTNTTDNVGTYSDAKGIFTLVSTDTVLDVQLRSLGFENSRIRLRSDLPTNQVTLQEDKSISPRILDTVKRNFAAVQRNGNLTFEEPEPADGWNYYDAYLANNLNVPETFDIKKNTGRDAVELSFEVNKNGEPVNIKVEKSLCDKCDKEAIRLVKEGPKWKRKAKKGKRTTVKVPFVKMD